MLFLIRSLQAIRVLNKICVFVAFFTAQRTVNPELNAVILSLSKGAQLKALNIISITKSYYKNFYNPPFDRLRMTVRCAVKKNSKKGSANTNFSLFHIKLFPGFFLLTKNASSRFFHIVIV